MTATTSKKAIPAPETHAWLIAPVRGGRRRVENLGWHRLAKMYYAAKPGSPIRKTIERQARACGYTPSTILSIHAA